MSQEEFYLPFANYAAFTELKAKARNLVNRYLADYSSDLLRVWETERPFELHVDGGIVNGRADVILDEEGGVVGSLAIVDYKTATDPKSDECLPSSSPSTRLRDVAKGSTSKPRTFTISPLDSDRRSPWTIPRQLQRGIGRRR